MSTETALAATEFVLNNADEVGSVPELYLFGGEPLLRWNEVVVPVVRHVREVYKRPCQIGITTNCLLLDEDKLRFLKANDVGLLVSMDGMRDTHDLNRKFIDGRGSFDEVNKKIPLILDYYPDVIARMTLTQATASSLDENILYLIKCGFLRVDCVPDIFTVWDDTSIDELKEAMRRVSNYYVSKFTVSHPEYGFQTFKAGFQDVKRVNHLHALGAHRCDNCIRCGIGIDRQAAINHLGDLYPCHEANCDDTLKMGNIFTGINEAARISLSSQYNQMRVRGLNCDTCRYDHVCNGGCAIFNYMISGGDFNAAPQMYCVWKQILLDECEYILDAMCRNKNVCFRDYFLTI